MAQTIVAGVELSVRSAYAVGLTPVDTPDGILRFKDLKRFLERLGDLGKDTSVMNSRAAIYISGDPEPSAMHARLISPSEIRWCPPAHLTEVQALLMAIERREREQGPQGAGVVAPV